MKRYIHDKLIDWKNRKERKPLIIKGARQIGKTYSLLSFGKESFPNFHYFNFEKADRLHEIFKDDLNPQHIINELSFYSGKSINIGQDLLIFDEIQHCPRALTSLKYFNEDLPQQAVCTAGSLLGLFFGETSFPVGKVEFLNMHPMTFEEFICGIGNDKLYEFIKNIKPEEKISEFIHKLIWEQLKIYFVVGGLPSVIETYKGSMDRLFDAVQSVRQKQMELINAYIADMAKHSGKEKAMHIERVWRNIPAQLAREQSGNSSRYRFNEVLHGTSRFERLIGPIDWLETTGLIIKTHIVNRSEIPLMAYASEKRFKLYLFDIGILGALSEIAPKSILDYDYGSYKGYFAENFVAQEFIYTHNERLYSWAEKTAEIEFLRQVEGDILPIEIKSGWVTKSKSLSVYSQKYKPKFVTIMSAKNLEIDRKRNIHRYPLYLAGKFPYLA